MEQHEQQPPRTPPPMPPYASPPPAPPAPQKSNRGLFLLFGLAGALLLCALLPLAFFFVALAAGGSGGGLASAAPRWEEQVIAGSGSERIVVIEVSGAIGVETPDFGGRQLTTEQYIQQIQQAANDSRVRAVVLRINSPGGGVVASNEIHAALMQFRETGKPLIASMGTVAASGGYYIATAAERIYANPDTFTGSLGVIISLLNYEETLEKIGLQQLVFKSGELKDIGSPARPLSDEERDILQAIVDQAYAGFVDVIVAGRNLPRDRVLELADGRIYTGMQAQQLGLVDELGNRDDAIAEAKTRAGLPDDALVVRYSSTPSLLSLLQGSLIQMQQPPDPLGLRQLTQPQTPLLEYRMVP